jgi:hypothetical protein
MQHFANTVQRRSNRSFNHVHRPANNFLTRCRTFHFLGIYTQRSEETGGKHFEIGGVHFCTVYTTEHNSIIHIRNSPAAQSGVSGQRNTGDLFCCRAKSARTDNSMPSQLSQLNRNRLENPNIPTNGINTRSAASQDNLNWVNAAEMSNFEI